MREQCAKTTFGPPGGGISALLVLVGRSHRLLASELLSDVGLHAGQGAMIQLLGDATLSQRELADRLGVEPPTITRMVQRLEQAGFVERRADERDGRITRIRLSPHGHNLRDPVEQRWALLEERTTAGLSTGDVEQLRTLLLQVLANLERAPEPHEGEG